MDAGMYDHSATQKNIAMLHERGVIFIGPESGHLASGLTGPGRMSDPSVIIQHIRSALGKHGPLAGKKVVITAGPTQEPVDPVRILTNHSSGRQGYAIAQAAVDAGASTVLVSGPSFLTAPAGVKIISIKTTAQMLETVLQETSDAEVLIMAAAPADFRPQQTADQKVKKSSGFNAIQLQPTEDILKNVAQRKTSTGFPRRMIGFAAESEHLIANAQKKLEEKRLDMIAANDITAPQAGFRSKTNQVTLISADGQMKKLPLMDKSEVAEAIIQKVCEWISQ